MEVLFIQPRNLDYPENTIQNFYFSRGIFFEAQCVFYDSKTGCKRAYEQRPTGARIVVPREDGYCGFWGAEEGFFLMGEIIEYWERFKERIIAYITDNAYKDPEIFLE